MKKRLGHGLALALLLVCAGPATADVVFTFDENGHADLNGVAVPGLLLPDPISGITTLTYAVAGISGDVLVTEPGTTGDSDLLRFIGGALYVFSNLPEPASPKPDLADVGVPGALQTNNIALPETGLGGNPYTDTNNGLIYKPGDSMPGAGVVTTFDFRSDLAPVPEPASLVMLGTGLAIVGLFRHSNRRRAA